MGFAEEPKAGSGRAVFDWPKLLEDVRKLREENAKLIEKLKAQAAKTDSLQTELDNALYD